MIPVLPTRDAVLLPGAVARLRVGRPCSVAAIRYAMERDARVVVLLQRSASTDAPRPDDLREIGCIGEVLSATRESSEAAAVSVLGLTRVRLEHVSEQLVAEVRELPWAPRVPELPSYYEELLRKLVDNGLRAALSAEASARLVAGTAAERLGAISALFLDADVVQLMLETEDLEPLVTRLRNVEKPGLWARVAQWLR